MAALLLYIDGDVTETTLDQFVEVNDFEPEEVAELRQTLSEGGVYVGGGGAAPIWAVGAKGAVIEFLDASA